MLRKTNISRPKWYNFPSKNFFISSAMPFTFTSEQKNKIRSILQGAGDVSSLSPEERHLLVLHWNWDDGQKEINWIIDQPDTDRGTALLIYWLISPRYLHQFATVQEVPEEFLL